MNREEAIQILETQFPHDSVIREALATVIPEFRERIEDERMLDSVIRIITQFDDLAHEPTYAGPKWTHPYTKEIAWLKSLRLQPKQEWSEEDDWKRKELIQYLEEKGDYRTVWMTWLKSLRPSWKPSEEQMVALDKAIPVCMGVVGRDEIAPLESLYEQLKKL